MDRKIIHSSATLLLLLITLHAAKGQTDNLFTAVTDDDHFLATNMFSKKVLFCDFDHDSDSDLLVLDDSTFEAYGVKVLNPSAVYTKQGNKFTMFQNLEKAYLDGRWIDIDGDAELEILALRETSEEDPFFDLYFLENNTYVLKQSIEMKGLSIWGTDFDLADMDNDGDLDMLLSAWNPSTSHSNLFYLLFRDGVFQSPVPLENMHSILSIKAVDINFDGKKDFLLSLRDIGFGIMINQGTGFNIPVDTVVSTHNDYITLGDLNNDDFMELTFLYSGLADSLYRLSKDFSLETVPSNFPLYYYNNVNNRLLILDYDHDGLNDILFGSNIIYPHSAPDYSLTFLWNRGNFMFKKIPLKGDFGTEVILADYNDDTNLDIITSRGTWVNAQVDLSGLILGAEPVIQQDDWKVFPNPTSDFIRWKIPTTNQNSVLIISSVSGEELKRYPLQGEKEGTMDISDLPPGLYLIRISTDEKTFRLIKK